MDRKLRKQIIKRAIGHYQNLIEHSQREYEPTPHHLRERLLKPLCKDFYDILELGTKNDTSEILEGFAGECKNFIGGGT